MNSTEDFLKTKTSKEKLVTALEVIKEFKECEGEKEWLLTPFVCWSKLEQLEEYLETLIK